METFSELLALWAGNPPVTSEFPTQRPVTWSFNVFFDLHLNKRLSKQSWGWWSETSTRPLWRNSNDHCRSLVLAYRYHESSKWCPAFGSNSETACHSRATDCPGTTFSMEELHQLNWSHCQWAKQIKQIISRTDRITLSEQFGAFSVEQIAPSGNGWMDAIDLSNDAPPILLKGSSPLPET